MTQMDEYRKFTVDSGHTFKNGAVNKFIDLEHGWPGDFWKNRLIIKRNKQEYGMECYCFETDSLDSPWLEVARNRGDKETLLQYRTWFTKDEWQKVIKTMQEL